VKENILKQYCEIIRVLSVEKARWEYVCKVLLCDYQTPSEEDLHIQFAGNISLSFTKPIGLTAH